MPLQLVIAECNARGCSKRLTLFTVKRAGSKYPASTNGAGMTLSDALKKAGYKAGDRVVLTAKRPPKDRDENPFVAVRGGEI